VMYDKPVKAQTQTRDMLNALITHFNEFIIKCKIIIFVSRKLHSNPFQTLYTQSGLSL